MSQPANPRLWAMFSAQARAHFRVFPSPAASHWIHDHYVKAGGRFVEPKDEKRKEKRRRLKEQHETEKNKDHK
jgi:hypothetical protein